MLINQIKKRDGRIVPFDSQKIVKAINNAIIAVGGNNLEGAEKLTDNVMDVLTSRFPNLDEIPTVEQVQDIVEEVLIKNGHDQVAKQYILYRHARSTVREKNMELMKTFKDLTFKDAVDNDLKRENANISTDTAMGTMLKYGSESSKTFSKLYVLKTAHSQAHENGDIHIHDLDFYMLTETCCQIGLRKLLKGGFYTGHGYLREPNSIQTAAQLTAIAIQSNQNDQHGGQSVPDFEYGLAPYVAKSYIKEILNLLEDMIWMRNDIMISEKFKSNFKSKLMKFYEENGTLLDKNGDDFIMDCIYDNGHGYELPMSSDDFFVKVYEKLDKDVYQAMEALIHNLNTLNSRAGSQVPFSSINYGTGTTGEQRLVIKNVLLATDAGLGHHETPIFPVQIFKVKDGISGNPNDPNYDLFKLACAVSAKRLFPNFSFIDAPFNLQYYKEGNVDTEAAYMGCVKGDETITVKINGKVYEDIKISHAYDFINNYVNTIYEETGDNSETYEFENSEDPKSHYIDTDQADIQILSGNKFVQLRGILKNNKKSTSDIGMVRVFYEKKSYRSSQVNSSIDCTVDHPFKTERGRIKANDLIPNADCLISVDGTEHKVIGVITIDSDHCTYDVETENDIFNLSGIISHNCRTRVLGNHYDPTREIVTGRGNLSFTSVNLPRLAILSEGDIDLFFDKLKGMVELVFDQLLERFKVQCRKKVKNYPSLMGQGIWIDSDKLGSEDSVEEVLKHGSLTVGFIGLAECLKSLTGFHHGESDESQQLGLKIIGFMREMCDKKSDETGLNFTLIGTPAEGLSGRFVRMDKERFGIIEGVTDREYYTNSFHVPVYYNISARDKILKEAPYHVHCNGGSITYIEVDGDPTKNVEAFEDIVQFMKKSGIGYGALNHPVDYCPNCGYTGIIDDKCPRCGNDGIHDIPLSKLKELQKIYPDIIIPSDCCQ